MTALNFQKTGIMESLKQTLNSENVNFNIFIFPFWFPNSEDVKTKCFDLFFFGKKELLDYSVSLLIGLKYRTVCFS